jgi:hypothetical protein
MRRLGVARRDHRIGEKAEAHGAAALGMVARRAGGAEGAAHQALADLIHRESLPVPATIKWAHEPRAFWPQLNTMTEAMRTGEPLTGDVQELYMEKFQLRPPEVSPAIRVRYTEKEEWVVEPNTP